MSPIRLPRGLLCFALLVVLLSCRNVVGFVVVPFRGGGRVAPQQRSHDCPTTRTTVGMIQSQVSTSETLEEKAPQTNDVDDDSLKQVLTSSPVILYDGVCNFCNAWVDILLRVDVNRKFKFAPLQSDIGRRLLMAIGKDANDISSVLLIEPNLDYYEKSAAPLRVAEELGPLAQIASRTAMTIVPKELRDSIYDTVAENRYNLMGKRDECRCSDPRFADRFVS